MADATLDHLDHDALYLCHLEPSIFADRLSPYHDSSPAHANCFDPNRSTPPIRFDDVRRSSSAGSQDRLRSDNHQTQSTSPRISRQLNEQRILNGRLLAGATDTDSDQLSSKGQAHRAGMVKGWYFTSHHMSFRRRFYPKRLTIRAFNQQYKLRTRIQKVTFLSRYVSFPKL